MKPPTSGDRSGTLRALLAGARVCYLSTVAADGPFGSIAPFVHDGQDGVLLVRLSRLARHTRHVLEDPRAALLVCENDGPDKNPLALVRATFTGRFTAIAPDHPAHARLKGLYLARFPEGAVTFELPDFAFFALRPEQIFLVAGFGKAFNLPPDALLGI